MPKTVDLELSDEQWPLLQKTSRAMRGWSSDQRTAFLIAVIKLWYLWEYDPPPFKLDQNGPIPRRHSS